MYLLDTNICIALMKNNRSVIRMFMPRVAACALSTIIVAELYKGVYCSQQRERNLKSLTEFLELLPILDFDQAAALEFGQIQDELRQLGAPTGEIDALIAAVARSQQLILVTNNIKHFENIPNLELDNWLV